MNPGKHDRESQDDVNSTNPNKVTGEIPKVDRR